MARGFRFGGAGGNNEEPSVNIIVDGVTQSGFTYTPGSKTQFPSGAVRITTYQGVDGVSIFGADVTKYKKLIFSYKNNFSSPMYVNVGTSSQVGTGTSTNPGVLQYDISNLTGVLPITLKFNNTTDLITTDIYTMYMTK